MNESFEPPRRSLELMGASDTALLVVDVQEKLLPVMTDPQWLVWNVRRLIEGAGVLGVPVIATEQYPQGLGPTIEELDELIEKKASKTRFSGTECRELFDSLKDDDIRKILVCGIESHVCVLQTVLDLMGEGWQVHVAADAVSSRDPFDRETALRRMEATGATLCTTETALFEWCETASRPEFKAISALVRQMGPPSVESGEA